MLSLSEIIIVKEVVLKKAEVTVNVVTNLLQYSKATFSNLEDKFEEYQQEQLDDKLHLVDFLKGVDFLL